MKTFGKVVLGLTVAVTVPASIAGVVFTAQHPQQVKTWFENGFQQTDQNSTAETEQNEQILTLQNQIKEYQSQIKNLQTAMEDLKQSHAEELAASKAEVQEYKTKYEQAQENVLSIQTQLDDCQSQISTLEQQKQELQESNEDYQEQITAINIDISELETEKSNLENALTTSQMMEQFYKQQYETTLAQVEGLETSNSSYVTQVSQMQSQIESLQSQIVFLEATIDSLEEQLEQGSSETAQEITDYIFYGNTLCAYLGSETNGANLVLPTSYSLQTVSTGEETTINNAEEFGAYIGQHSSDSFFIQFNGEDKVYITPYSLGMFMESLDESAAATMFPATAQIAECKFVTGNDYQITDISGYTFEGSQITELYLPETIERVSSSVFAEIDTLHITRTDKLVEFYANINGQITAGSSQIYVPQTMLESYKTTYSQMADNFVGVGAEI